MAKKRPKQARLAGMESPTNKAVTKQAEEFRALRRKRLALQGEEAAMEPELLALMKKHGIQKCELDDDDDLLITTPETKEKLKLSKRKELGD